MVGTGTLLENGCLDDDGAEQHDDHNNRMHEEAAHTCGVVGMRMHEGGEDRVEAADACHG